LPSSNGLFISSILKAWAIAYYKQSIYSLLSHILLNDARIGESILQQEGKSMTGDNTVDVAVIGAGLAGLICAQQLKQAGYQVVVVEKSRGLGGRLATRRLYQTCADHGVRSFTAQGKLTQHLIQALLTLEVIHPWTDEISVAQSISQEDATQFPTHYTAQSGLTAIAKFLAKDLEILRGQRVQALEEVGCWQLLLETSGTNPVPPLLARSIVMAIPAPQALMLLEPLSEKLPNNLLQQIRSVQFDPCITAIAIYPSEKLSDLQQLPWQFKTFADASDLAWLSIENTKRPAEMPVVVVQSSAEFAERYLEAPDLQPVGQRLLDAATDLASWLQSPVELQVHRWRYAFVCQPLLERCLATALPLPLVCSGDWCGERQSGELNGRHLESAMESGLAAARQISQLLEPSSKTTMPDADYEERCFHQLLQQLATL
jgi:renalase